METLPPLSRGDLIEIVWVDICEDSIGNPDKTDLLRRTSFGLFWETKLSHGVNSIVTTTTLEEDHSQSGYCIYPTSCIIDLKVIKKAKRKLNGTTSRSSKSIRSKRRFPVHVVETLGEVHTGLREDTGKI